MKQENRTMKRFSFVFVLVVLLGVALEDSQGNRIPGLPMNKVDAVFFLDADHGFVQQQSQPHPEPFETLDGGKTWDSIDRDGKSCLGGLGFFFLDEKHAWAVGGKTQGNMEGGTKTGFVTVTKDGGKTCEELPQVPGQLFWSVFFLNEREGW